MTHTTLDLTADIIDTRDIIARIEEMESLLEDMSEADREADKVSPTESVTDEYHDMHCELLDLKAIMEEMKGYGGDEQWRGDWYPVTLIRESYFVDYVQEILEDCGEIPSNLPHYIHIDWESTARDVKVDYSSVTIDDVEYLYR